MIRTTKGMPNTCSNCGAGPLEECWAESEDHARAGLGLCKDCAALERPAEPESAQIWAEIGLTEPIEALLHQNGVTIAWLRQASETEILNLSEINGVGPGTTHRLLEWLNDQDL